MTQNLAAPENLVLVGDIGGTNARFALIDPSGAVVARDTLAVSNHPRFDDALALFLSTHGHPRAPAAACLAVAGPVTGGKADFTNSAWTIDEVDLRGEFGFETPLVVNDFEALSRFALSPLPADVELIKRGQKVEGAPVLTIGPGTGLGQGLSVPSPGGVVPISTEGGHVTLPAVTKEEIELVKVLMDMLGRRPAAEDIIAGSGMVRLHLAMAKRDGRQSSEPSPAEITDSALKGDGPCRATVAQFCAFLGTVASNAALSTGARGGVMLAGGILPKIKPLFLSSPFTERFIGESTMGDYLELMPVDLLVAGDAALRGAAQLLRDRGC